MIRTAWALHISSSLFGYGLNNVMPSDASVQEISWPNVVEVFEQEQRVTTGAAEAANIGCHRRCCMIQLRREWGRFSNFSFRTPQRRISAYPARPSG